MDDCSLRSPGRRRHCRHLSSFPRISAPNSPPRSRQQANLSAIARSDCVPHFDIESDRPRSIKLEIFSPLSLFLSVAWLANTCSRRRNPLDNDSYLHIALQQAPTTTTTQHRLNSPLLSPRRDPQLRIDIDFTAPLTAARQFQQLLNYSRIPTSTFAPPVPHPPAVPPIFSNVKARPLPCECSQCLATPAPITATRAKSSLLDIRETASAISTNGSVSVTPTRCGSSATIKPAINAEPKGAKRPTSTTKTARRNRSRASVVKGELRRTADRSCCRRRSNCRWRSYRRRTKSARSYPRSYTKLAESRRRNTRRKVEVPRDVALSYSINAAGRIMGKVGLPDEESLIESRSTQPGF